MNTLAVATDIHTQLPTGNVEHLRDGCSLIDEYLNAVANFEGRRKEKAVPYLEGLGIKRHIATGLCVDYWPLGLARIRTFADGTYDPHPGGDWYYLTPVAYGYPDDPDFNIAEMVAWKPSDPGIWLRTGSEPLLGPDAAHCARWSNEPLDVCEGPRAWLRGGCVGVSIINWDRLWPADLASTLVCADADLGRRVEEVYRACGTHDVVINVRTKNEI